MKNQSKYVSFRRFILILMIYKKVKNRNTKTDVINLRCWWLIGKLQRLFYAFHVRVCTLIINTRWLRQTHNIFFFVSCLFDSMFCLIIYSVEAPCVRQYLKKKSPKKSIEWMSSKRSEKKKNIPSMLFTTECLHLHFVEELSKRQLNFFCARAYFCFSIGSCFHLYFVQEQKRKSVDQIEN